MTHQHTEAKYFPLKNEEPSRNLETHGTKLHVLRNPRVPRKPCWRALV